MLDTCYYSKKYIERSNARKRRYDIVLMPIYNDYGVVNASLFIMERGCIDTKQDFQLMFIKEILELAKKYDFPIKENKLCKSFEHTTYLVRFNDLKDLRGNVTTRNRIHSMKIEVIRNFNVGSN